MCGSARVGVELLSSSSSFLLVVVGTVANGIALLDRAVVGAVVQALGKRLGQTIRTIGRNKGQQPSKRISRGSSQGRLHVRASHQTQQRCPPLQLPRYRKLRNRAVAASCRPETELVSPRRYMMQCKHYDSVNDIQKLLQETLHGAEQKENHNAKFLL